MKSWSATKRQLKKIIREEKYRIFQEQASLEQKDNNRHDVPNPASGWAKPTLYDMGFEDAQLEDDPQLDNSEYMAGYVAGKAEAQAYAASQTWEHN